MSSPEPTPTCALLTFDGCSGRRDGPAGAAAILWSTPGPDGQRCISRTATRCLPAGTTILAAEGIACALALGIAPVGPCALAGDARSIIHYGARRARLVNAQVQAPLEAALRAAATIGVSPRWCLLDRRANDAADRLARQAANGR